MLRIFNAVLFFKKLNAKLHKKELPLLFVFDNIESHVGI